MENPWKLNMTHHIKIDKKCLPTLKRVIKRIFIFVWLLSTHVLQQHLWLQTLNVAVADSSGCNKKIFATVWQQIRERKKKNKIKYASYAMQQKLILTYGSINVWLYYLSTCLEFFLHFPFWLWKVSDSTRNRTQQIYWH